MVPVRQSKATFTVYKCGRCQIERVFDMLQNPASGNNTRRCFQYHVEHFHSDYEGDWRDLIGEKIVRRRGRKVTGGQNVADDTASYSETSLLSSSITTNLQSQSIISSTLRPVLTGTSQNISKINSFDSCTHNPDHTITVEPIAPVHDNVPYSHKLIFLARQAKSKISKINQGLQNDTPVIIGIDAWDQAAISGKLDEDIRVLAEAAFPTDLFNEHFTVVNIYNEDILRSMMIFYQEKAERFEHGVRDQDVEM